ncbi:MAG: hypothetical protein RIQ81_1194 [Pseudomonadota bacterium]|jgi:hypothetical protein
MQHMVTSNKKWTVYRRGEAIGTFSAAEIREELRKGVLSPNDFAAAEDSVLQQEIIEIDEIFSTSGDDRSFFSDSPRKSRQDAMPLEGALDGIPATRPRNQRLRPGPRAAQDHHGRRQAGNRPPGNQNHRDSGQMGSLEILLWGLGLAAAAVAAAWFLRLPPFRT